MVRFCIGIRYCNCNGLFAIMSQPQKLSSENTLAFLASASVTMKEAL